MHAQVETGIILVHVVAIKFQNLAALYLESSRDCVDEVRRICKSVLLRRLYVWQFSHEIIGTDVS